MMDTLGRTRMDTTPAPPKSRPTRAGWRRALGIALALVAGSYLLAAGWPLGLLGVWGQVVDRDTGRPIPGAAVQWRRSVSCWLLIHGDTYHFRPRETRTTAAGRFWFGPDLRLPACLTPFGPDSRVHVLAPGYRLETGVRRGVIPLEPATRRSELTALAEPRWSEPDEGPIWRATRATMTTAVRPAAPLGVFVTVAGAQLDQLILLSDAHQLRPRLLLARDARTGQVHAWDGDGQPVPLPLTGPGWGFLGVYPSLHLPLFTHGDRLVFPQRPPARWLGPGFDGFQWGDGPLPAGTPRGGLVVWATLLTVAADGHTVTLTPLSAEGPDLLTRTEAPAPTQPVAALFPGATGPVACLAPAPTGWGLAVIGADEGDRLYRLSPGGQPLQIEPLRAAPGALPRAVSACAATDHTLYIAGDDGHVVALDPKPGGPGGVWSPRPEFRFPLPGAPRPVTGLGVTALGTQLYAVAGDEHVYVFTRDGAPDQRIALDPTTR
jgi:hypothetical protein